MEPLPGGRDRHPNNVNTVAHVWPRFIAALKIRTPKAVLHASTPTNNRQPTSCASYTTTAQTYHDRKARPADHSASFSGYENQISKTGIPNTNTSPDDRLRLHPIHRIKGLIQPQAQGPGGIDPRGTILIQSRIIPEHGQEVGDDEHEARKSDLEKPLDRITIYVDCRWAYHNALDGETRRKGASGWKDLRRWVYAKESSTSISKQVPLSIVNLQTRGELFDQGIGDLHTPYSWENILSQSSSRTV